MQKLLLIIIQKIAPQAKSGKYFQIWFFPRFGGKNGGVLSMRMQVILDSSFARPGSAPIWGGKKGEFRDWTNLSSPPSCGLRTKKELRNNHICWRFLKRPSRGKLKLAKSCWQTQVGVCEWHKKSRQTRW